MDIPSYFQDFLSGIRLTQSQKDECKSGQETLRKRLREDDDLSPIIIATLLQGSYRRSTGVRPKEREKADVDVIVVTSLDKDKTTPEQAIKKFVPFLDKHYSAKYTIQGRSIAIELSHVSLDLVPTATGLQELARYRQIWAAAGRIQEDVEDDDSMLRSVLIEASRKGFNSPVFIPDREAKQWVPATTVRFSSCEFLGTP